ncbi:MAG: threonylcarbamoyl-AMP synthase [Acidobacteria bacterium]|nr:threonylcarbamoyl-AMP synthase [Acidobacteriota bacterium]
MGTELLEISCLDPDPAKIQEAADRIKRGQVVAIPTDTLYTLVADPFSLHAVSSVFRAKGRELHRSLPILVDSITMAEDYAAQPLSARFFLLARRFWPGPLTIITPSSSLLPLKVTGNSGRLAIRQSASPLVQKLVETLEGPVISTSANRSGQPTCRSGIEVFGEMDGRVDLILDGGAVEGAGATTVDITEPEWRLIKEGAVSRAQLEAVLDGGEG